MRNVTAGGAGVACLLIAGCVTTPGGLPFRGKTQDLVVRTHPEGATCSVLRAGDVVSVVEPTPGTAVVLRKDSPIEIVCRKEGFLDFRETFIAENAAIVERDEAPVASSTEAGAAVAYVAAQGIAQSASVAVSAAAWTAAAAGAVVVAPIAAIVIAVNNPPYAIRPLREFELTPARFGSESARDAYFVRRTEALEAFGSAERTRISDSCRRTYCLLELEAVEAAGTSRQPEDCFTRFCQREVDRANAEQTLRVERLGGDRTQARVGPH